MPHEAIATDRALFRAGLWCFGDLRRKRGGDPWHRRAFEVERIEQRRFAAGDRIQFRTRDRSLDVADGTRLAEADARRWNERWRRERWRTVVSLLAMLGGFLTGQRASYRSGATMKTGPTVNESEGTNALKSAHSAPRRPPGSSSRPTTPPAR